MILCPTQIEYKKVSNAMDAEKLAFDLVDKFGLDSVRRTVISVCYGSRDRA
jgi:hypothetical protein